MPGQGPLRILSCMVVLIRWTLHWTKGMARVFQQKIQSHPLPGGNKTNCSWCISIIIFLCILLTFRKVVMMKTYKRKDKSKLDDSQNNALPEEALSKKCKTESSHSSDSMLHIQDISSHSKSSGKLGPILTSFSHAPCSVPLVAASQPDCSIGVNWVGNWPQARLVLFNNIRSIV